MRTNFVTPCSCENELEAPTGLAGLARRLVGWVSVMDYVMPPGGALALVFAAFVRAHCRAGEGADHGRAAAVGHIGADYRAGYAADDRVLRLAMTRGVAVNDRAKPSACTGQGGR